MVKMSVNERDIKDCLKILGIPRPWREAVNLLKKQPEWPIIQTLLGERFQDEMPKLEDIWSMMDRVWDSHSMKKVDGKYPDEELLKYYSHPVWLLNGLWIESHELSIENRCKFAKLVKLCNKEKPLILDLGGGFGTLGKIIATLYPEATVEVWEPCTSDLAIRLSEDIENMRFIDFESLNYEKYDCVFSMDVIEHLNNPLSHIRDANYLLKRGGIFIIGWNFSPVIKCHLSYNFHYRYIMKECIKLLGFGYIKKDENSYAYVFKKIANTRDINLKKAEILGKIAKIAKPAMDGLRVGKNLLGSKLKRVV